MLQDVGGVHGGAVLSKQTPMAHFLLAAESMGSFRATSNASSFLFTNVRHPADCQQYHMPDTTFEDCFL
eukprot:108465-Amphidinium_carterae.1